MKKNLTIISLSIFCVLQSVAQNATDMSKFTAAKWQTETLRKGITWEHYHFNDMQLFNSNQNINIVRMGKKMRRWQWAFVSGGDSLLKTSTLAYNAQAMVGINGSFFDVKNGGAVDFIRVDGKTLDTTVLNKGKRAEHQKAALVLDKNTLKILRGDSLDLKWDEKLNYYNIMVTGPLLLLDNQPVTLIKSAFNDNRHPRSCVCITNKKEILLITIDGRTAESQGVSLPELRQITQRLNCKDAINLDGGGSTTLYIEGKPDNGVVNMPCDNKLFDHLGERKVSNIIVVKKRP
jgi:exopolysaccharide biosynthesis protein